MRVLMIVKSGVTDDARVLREATALVGRGHQVEVIGHRMGRPADGLPFDVRWVREASTTETVRRSPWMRPIRWLLLPEHRRREEAAFARAVTALDLEPPDVVHAHDFNALVPAAQIARRLGSRLVYDSHECWTGRRLVGRPTPLAVRRARRAERELGAEADEVITVSDALARWFLDVYGWSDVTVVRNSFPQLDDAPAPPHAPTALMYAGRIDEERDLATASAASSELPLPLEVMGDGDDALVRRLGDAGVSMHRAVPIAEMPDHLRRAGLALVSLTGDQLNHLVALPNKLLQAVQVGVPVVAARLPAIEEIVAAHRIGVLYEPMDPRSLVAATAEAVDRYPELVDNVARARAALSWQHDERVLTELYERLERRAVA